VEYSAREVCPQDLMLQHLLRAHSIFLLHQAPCLSDLWIRLNRTKFCNILERFWNRFIRDWDVLFHGNPASDIFQGLKLSPGGELGVGVGEEEWGSGEREVLEGFIHRTDGLVDLLAARFGNASEDEAVMAAEQTQSLPWLGSGAMPSSTDGIIFSGTDAVSRSSLCDISAWLQWIYKYGQDAYGISENPTAPRRRRQRNQQSAAWVEPPTGAGEEQSQPLQSHAPGIPPPIVRAASKSLESATLKAATTSENQLEAPSGTDTMLKYMTLGVYGSSWGIPSGRPTYEKHVEESSSQKQPEAHAEQHSPQQKPFRNLAPRPVSSQPSLADSTNGCFLIGLQGSLIEEPVAFSSDDDASDDSGTDVSKGEWNQRIHVRTLHVELTTTPLSASEPPSPTRYERLRVMIYIRRPFIFVFLFEQNTSTLSYTSLYRSLHHQLGPLQRSLLRSTDPANTRARIHDALGSPRTLSPLSENTDENPIYDLVWDPELRTVHSTIPPIPDPGTLAAEGLVDNTGKETPWSRLDALSVHSQILAILKDTRQRPAELERTVKTSRGWWIVWMRLPRRKQARKDRQDSSSGSGNLSLDEYDENEDQYRRERRGEIEYKEAVLVRRAVDHTATKGKASRGWMVGAGSSSREESRYGGVSKMVEGIGVDARRYVEGLMRISR
jgi:hypothetical protein